MKWLQRHCLDQPIKTNPLLNRYDKRPWPALRNEKLSIDHNGSQTITKLLKCLVSAPKVLSPVSHHKANNIFSNDYRGKLLRLPHFIQDANPLPKQAGTR